MKTALITGITGQDGSYLTNCFLRRDILYMELLGEAVNSTLSGLIICIINPGY